MNIIFLTLFSIKSIDSHDIYTDLMREFAKNNHKVYIVTPTEKRNNEATNLIKYDTINDWHSNVEILRVRIGNVQKTGFIEKGISTLTLEHKIKSAIKKYYKNVKFDLILYSTPPITLYKAIKYVKGRDNSKTYLMLKDIFPQNSLDLGVLKKTGIKGFIYRYFKSKEKKLYKISDFIGCMSKANADYIIKENSYMDASRVGISPNSIEIVDISINKEEKNELKEKYNIPKDKKVFVYGGNLGRPQCIDFLIECLEECAKIDNAFFLIVGDGTDYGKLKNYYESKKSDNFKLMNRLPKDDYDKMILSCDVGLIFLDKRFTIPNYPSRILSYMQAKLPIIACTDVNTDVGKTIVEGNFGWWCESKDASKFKEIVLESLESDLINKGNTGYKYLLDNYTVDKQYNSIMKEVEKI